jgi:hypothetical protein
MSLRLTPLVRQTASRRTGFNVNATLRGPALRRRFASTDVVSDLINPSPLLIRHGDEASPLRDGEVSMLEIASRWI